MATTEASEPTRAAVFDELAEELQVYRSGVHGGRMAEHLLRYENGRDLVGVGPRAERAFYYELASRRLVAFEFDKHDVRSEEQELLTPDLDDPSAWIDVFGGGFVWIHPRYR